METFETKIEKAKRTSYWYLVLTCIMAVVFFFSIFTFFNERASLNNVFFACFFAVMCFGLELMHFFFAGSYYPKTYTKIKEKITFHSIIEDPSDVISRITMCIYPIPFLLLLNGYSISNIVYLILGFVMYITSIRIHLKLSKKTKSSCYVTEKNITIDLKTFLPDYYSFSKTNLITYYVPFGCNEEEYRDIAVMEKVKEIENKEILEAKNKKEIETISKEIASKMK